MFGTIEYLMIATISISIPFILSGIGGVFSVRGGVMALGLESMLMMGAFMAVIGSYYTNNSFIGLITGMLGGVLIAFLYGVLSIKYRVNQVIAGIGLNMLALSLTTLFTELIWGNKSSSVQVSNINVDLTFLKPIPIIGNIIGSQSILVVITIIIILAANFILFRTVYGLRLRTCGESPKTAATMGLKVSKLKYSGVLICGAVAGLGGAYLSIDNLNMFQQNMTAGRGYIAVAIAILSRYKPTYVVFYSLLFAFMDALQIYLQGKGVPSQLMQTIPYITTLLVLTFGVRFIKPPAGLGSHED